MNEAFLNENYPSGIPFLLCRYARKIDALIYGRRSYIFYGGDHFAAKQFDALQHQLVW